MKLFYRFKIILNPVYLLVLILTPLSACQNSSDQEHQVNSQSETQQAIQNTHLSKQGHDKADSSAHALFLNYSFDGMVKLKSRYWPERSIESQLLFSIGQFNGDQSVGRLDKLVLTDIEIKSIADGFFEVSYHAEMIIAWGKSTKSFPDTYTLVLPYDNTTEGLARFTELYKDSCVGGGAHDVDVDTMWYYYRPDAYLCVLMEGDVVRTEGKLEVSEITTTGKYPEYEKVWEDDVLKVVAIFGHAHEDKDTPWDQGIQGYQDFYNKMKMMGSQAQLHITPEIGLAPTREQNEYQIDAIFDDGRRVQINALSVVNVRTAGSEFNQRYHELSAEADLIIYNGHAGLGANIRALARKGNWKTGQYSIVFMNGCDTYAYVDNALFEAHALINEDDELGTRYVDVINNAMPSYFHAMAQTSATLVQGLLQRDDPLNYEQIFKDVDRRQIILVSGEEDNQFIPNAGDQPDPWEDISLEISVKRGEIVRFDTPMLQIGTYRFTMHGSKDADLYVRIGLEPDEASFDCRPYSVNSEEVCEITIDRPVHLFAMVRGWSSQSEVSVEVSQVHIEE